MTHQRETIITVSKETHEGILANALGTINLSKTTFHADGTVSFPISPDVLRELKRINASPELAIREKLGIKTN